MENLFSSFPGKEQFTSIFNIIRALVIALNVVLVVLFLYAFKKTLRFRPHFDLKKTPKKKLLTLRNAYYKDQWHKILKRYTETPTPDSIRLALIEGDSLVDHLLKDLKFPGDHLADRLSHLNGGGIKSLEGVWEAHKLRNQVVHHPASGVGVREGMAALGKYERFFHELNIL